MVRTAPSADGVAYVQTGEVPGRGWKPIGGEGGSEFPHHSLLTLVPPIDKSSDNYLMEGFRYPLCPE